MAYWILYLFFIVSLWSCVSEKKELTFKGVAYKASLSDSIVYMGVNKECVEPINLIDGLKEVHKDTEQKVKRLLDLVDEISFFIPETTASSIIGVVSKVIRTDDRVYVLDNEKSNALFVFDQSGKFINEIGNVGSGPGEFVEPTDFEIDEAEGVVYIYDQYQSFVNRYDMDGRYLGRFRLLFRSKGLVKIGDEFVFQNLLGNDHIEAIKKSALTVTDTSGLPTQVGLSMLRYNFVSDCLVRINDEMVHHMIPYNDTIYHITPNGFFARYAFVFPESNRLPKDFVKRAGPIYEKFKERFPSNRYTYYENGCWETASHVMVTLNHEDVYCTVLYSKEDRSSLVVPRILNSDDFSMISLALLLNKPVSGYKNHFIIPVYMPDFWENLDPVFSNMSEDEKKEWVTEYPELNDWSQEDNPLICFLRFKSNV